MSSTANVYEELFDGAPSLRMPRSLGLVKADQLLDVRRALFAVLIGWLPMALGSTPFLIALTNRQRPSFLTTRFMRAAEQEMKTNFR